ELLERKERGADGLVADDPVPGMRATEELEDLFLGRIAARGDDVDPRHLRRRTQIGDHVAHPALRRGAHHRATEPIERARLASIRTARQYGARSERRGTASSSIGIESDRAQKATSAAAAPA